MAVQRSTYNFGTQIRQANTNMHTSCGQHSLQLTRTTSTSHLQSKVDSLCGAASQGLLKMPERLSDQQVELAFTRVPHAEAANRPTVALSSSPCNAVLWSGDIPESWKQPSLARQTGAALSLSRSCSQHGATDSQAVEQHRALLLKLEQTFPGISAAPEKYDLDEMSLEVSALFHSLLHKAIPESNA